MSQTAVDTQTIFNYSTHRNIPWNIIEYQPLHEYLDPNQSLTERKRQAGQIRTPYATKKGFYMDYHIKTVKELPAPCHYPFDSDFDQTENIKQSAKHKINFKLKKNSYLQQIERQQKILKQPGVGQYQLLFKSQSVNKKKSRSNTRKTFFYEDTQFLSTTVPGSGCYYPHDGVQNIKSDRTNHKFWIDKHSRQRKSFIKRKSKEPAPGTYQPISCSFNSFDKMHVFNSKQKRKSSKKPTHGFGSSDTKFTYERPSKTVIKEQRPQPTRYETRIDWKGKGVDAKKNNWVRCLSAGPTRSIYH